MYKVKADNSKLSKDKSKSDDEIAAIKSRVSIAKLILNALYGFTITNVQKQSNVDVYGICDKLLKKS